MKQSKKASTCLMAVVLMTIVAAMTASAAAAALEGRLVLRPLTPGDISVYKLPSTTETSPGLTTVGIGAPVYLEAEINIAIPASDIVSVTWVLTNRPAFSSAFLTNSPLGHECPRLWAGGSCALSGGRTRAFAARPRGPIHRGRHHCYDQQRLRQCD